MLGVDGLALLLLLPPPGDTKPRLDLVLDEISGGSGGSALTGLFPEVINLIKTAKMFFNYLPSTFDIYFLFLNIFVGKKSHYFSTISNSIWNKSYNKAYILTSF